MRIILKHRIWLILLLVLGTISFNLRSLKEIVSEIDFLPPPESRSLSFHPDAVRFFEWKMANGKSFIFHRKSVSVGWNESQASSDIQKRLNFLSQAHLVPFQFSKPTKIEITINFSNNNEWKGAWDGENFIWISGNAANQGIKLNSTENLLFIAGNLAFEQKELNWCDNRPSYLEINTEDKIQFFQEDHQWKIKGRDLLVTSEIEKWLAAYCTIKIENYIDPQFFKPSDELTYFEVGFVDRTAKRWVITKDSYFFSNDSGFSSNEFSAALYKLFEL